MSRFKETKLQNCHDSIEKIAICYYPLQCFSSNTKRLLGYHLTDLELLKLEGYKVIHVDYYEWTKMSMREDTIKINYIENLFQEQGIDLKSIRLQNTKQPGINGGTKF